MGVDSHGYGVGWVGVGLVVVVGRHVGLGRMSEDTGALPCAMCGH